MRSSVGTNPAPGASCNRFDTSLATTSAGWPAICATINNDLWFSFTPASTGPYIIDTKNPCGYVAGTATDTTIAVYTSCVAGAPIACNGNAGNNSLSMVNPTLTDGDPYLIRVGNVTLNTGTGTFYLNVNPGTAIPANDLCASATPVVLGTNPAPAASCNTFTNEFATSDMLGYPRRLRHDRQRRVVRLHAGGRRRLPDRHRDAGRVHDGIEHQFDPGRLPVAALSERRWHVTPTPASRAPG